MMRSLFAAVSGLRGHQTRMDVIGNNVANVNTIGFKSSRTTFADTLSQTTAAASAPQDGTGGTNAKQIGLGANVASIDLLFTDGSPQTTGNNTDLAISGDGLFIVTNSNGTYYTRDGSFAFDADGNFVLPGSGLYVQGWMADDAGVLMTSGAVGNITIPNNRSMEATATTIATYTGNLNAATTGYEIGSILVNYTNGNSVSTTNYTPTAVAAGTIILTLSSGEQVTLDSTAATSEFVENSSIAGLPLYTSTVASVTASNELVDVTLSPTNGSGIWFVNGSDAAFTVNNLTTGTFIPGSTTPVTGNVTAVQTVYRGGQQLVQLTLTDAAINGNTYDNGNMTILVGDNSYEVGDIYAGSLNVDSITARQGATVNLADGTSTTVHAQNIPPMTFTSTNDEFIRYGNDNDGTITAIDRTSYTSYMFNGNLVDSVRVNTSSGLTLDGLTGQSYTTGSTAMFYPSTTTMFTVYDSLGSAHSIPILITKSSANTWEIALSGGGTTYSMTEDDGSVTTVTLTKSPSEGTLTYNADGSYAGGSASLSIRTTNGANDMSVAVELSGTTQYSGSNNINASADGNAAGILNSLSFDTTGTVIGTYSNGLKRNEAQVALATFTNSAGLTKTSNSLYQESNNSGTPTISTVSDLGSSITPSALEMSNVDIANEFSDMIVTQRGFQSNSKMISVADEMLETLINMKR